MSIKIKRFMDFHGLRRFIAQSNLLGSATTACPVPVIRRGLRAAISVRMAELGDLLMGGSKREKDVTVDMLDYDFLDKCSDPNLIRAIVRKLKSGEEGHYPNLEKHAEARLLEVLPQDERVKILRMKAEPQPEEVNQAIHELRDWENEIARMSAKIKENGQQPRAPGWTSCTKAEDQKRTSKVVELQTTPLGNTEDMHKAHKTHKLHAYDFKAWEGYNADEEVRKLEKEEEEEERLKNEVITSTKARAKQDELRRAQKRDEQLCQARKGRFKESLSLVEMTRAAQREHLKGNESFKAKEYEEAFRCYTCSLALDDTNAKVFNNRAASAHKMERFDQAEDDCTRAIYLDPQFKKAWVRRGMVRYSRGKYAGSVADFAEALHLQPDDKHVQKLRDHSVAKEREVEGERATRTHEVLPKGKGRIFIEEVDVLEDDCEQDVAAHTPPTIMAPPCIPGGKATAIARGWADVTRTGLRMD